MKILFVYSTVNCICTTKCCYELALALKKYCTAEVINYKLLNNEVIKSFDVIILQRIGDGTQISEEYKKNIFKSINQNKRKIFVYLVDDLIIESQDGLPRELAIACDAVMCSNSNLCNNFMRYNKNTFKFSTFIDVNFYESIRRNTYTKFTMAWVSTDGIGIDIINQIISYNKLKKMDMNIIAIGGQSHKLIKADNVKTYGILSEKKVVELIKGSDLLLNPITSNDRINNIIRLMYKTDVQEFLNSKAEIKYLMAGMCHSCLVTSNTDCYRGVINNDINGFILPNGLDDWSNLIINMYNNRPYLNQIKENAYRDVKEKYDVNKIAKDIYIKLNQIEKRY